MSKTKHEKSCGAVVYKLRNNHLFFLVEHMIQGHTSIPKGHVEGKETEAETALREIREETNLEVKLDTVFHHEISYSPYEGIEKQVIFFIAEAATDHMKNQESEVTSLEWLPYEAAIDAVTYDTDKETLAHAAAYLGRKYSLPISRNCLKPLGGYSGLWYREHAADIHSHVVPRVDDGAGSLEEALELLRLDREEGIQTVFATPHYGIENGYAPRKENILSGFHRLAEAATKHIPGIRLELGTEWYCAEEIAERIRREEAFPLAHTDWYLVEFMEWGNVTESAEDILHRLKKLQDNQIKTILAHPERYRAIQQDWDLAKRICDLGVLLQVNAYDLYLNTKEATRNLAQWMAKEELISFLGSDMHGIGKKADGKEKRRPQMKEGIRWLYENTDEEYANDVVRRNAEKYLGIERLQTTL